jgi:hypothetical protein
VLPQEVDPRVPADIQSSAVLRADYLPGLDVLTNSTDIATEKS